MKVVREVGKENRLSFGCTLPSGRIHLLATRLARQWAGNMWKDGFNMLVQSQLGVYKERAIF